MSDNHAAFSSQLGATSLTTIGALCCTFDDRHCGNVAAWIAGPALPDCLSLIAPPSARDCFVANDELSASAPTPVNELEVSGGQPTISANSQLFSYSLTHDEADCWPGPRSLGEAGADDEAEVGGLSLELRLLIGD